jgi:DNA polymerase III alpha subunit
VKYDKYGQAYTTENEICDILYQNPEQDISLFKVEGSNVIHFNQSNELYYKLFEPLQAYLPVDYKEDVPVELFDHVQQSNWYMPDEYKTLDIAQWLLDQCKTDPELQRVGQELLLYQERELFHLLRYLKYFVDTMRKNNVVWGLGRGSSVASYVLYLIGVHKVNSMYYDLDIGEFLR